MDTQHKTLGISRRTFTAASAALAAGGAVFTGRARAQAFPSKPVRLYVGASAGGAPDLTARTMSKILGDSWGQPIVVDNRPGVSGLLAGELTSQAPPDGHTLCLLLDSVLNTVPFLTDKMPIDPIKDLKPIAMAGGFPLVLIAHPSAKLRNLQELSAAAKAAPGKLNYASSGLGSSGHLAMEMFARTAGLKLNHIPYKGGIPALQDTIAGQIPLLWGSVSACLQPIQAGKVVALAVGSAERFVLLPNVPTAAEQGYPGFTAGNWMGVLGPAALPDALVQKIHGDMARLSQSAAFRDALLAQGIEPRTMPTPEFARLIRTEYDRNKTLFASLGLGPSK